MKKLIALLVVTGFLVGAGLGCSGSSGTTAPSKPADKKPDDTKKP